MLRAFAVKVQPRIHREAAKSAKKNPFLPVVPSRPQRFGSHPFGLKFFIIDPLLSDDYEKGSKDLRRPGVLSLSTAQTRLVSRITQSR
ncbi:MAG: hypothetical protein DMG10_30520 [Acidobacteria bacterium]|nr:MAG: hypothetical protein DMG10_30520 [Acidobacteriota bacterium]